MTDEASRTEIEESPPKRTQRRLVQRLEQVYPRSFVEGMRDLDSNPRGSHVVLFLHGIRATSEGFDSTIEHLQFAIENTDAHNPVTLVPLQYPRISLLKTIYLFWTGKYPSAATWVRDQIAAVQYQHDVERCSIIAHSFGTYLVVRMLESVSDLKFHHIVFCGSVADPNFDWGLYQGKYSSVTNDCGTSDGVVPLTRLLKLFGAAAKFGASGRSPGFNSALARNRYFRGIRHGDFFREEFEVRYWAKLLLENLLEFPPIDDRETKRR